MNLLVKEFENIGWVVKQESIFSTSIPLLKLEIDPSIPDNEEKLNLNEVMICELKQKYHQSKMKMKIKGYYQSLKLI